MPRRRWLVPWRRARHVLGLNARNLLYVHGMNRRCDFPMADDKVLTKSLLGAAGVPTPETLAVLRNMSEVSHAFPALERAREFVVKPARGRQGGGIIVVVGMEQDRFRAAGGKLIAWEQLRRAMGDILFGVHSVGQTDVVLIERRILSHSALGDLATAGLPDIRIILLSGNAAMGMMRVPTRLSGGRANLHRGAVGIGLDLADGRATRAVLDRRPIERHPDNDALLTGFRVPMWEDVLSAARRAAECLPLPYLGVDIVLDEMRGPLVMEVNARPGLEIQNVNGQGLRRRLSHLPRRAGQDEDEIHGAA